MTAPRRLAASARRARGGRGRLELFFAFDDPCSAVALIDLAARLAGRPVDLAPYPVVRRGIAGDPAAELKRAYAVTDARRLARRHGLELARDRPLAAGDTAFLARWSAGAPGSGSLVDFCCAALRALWFEDQDAVRESRYAELWRQRIGYEPHPDDRALRRCEARMARRGPYETPAAWTAGRWYFAHDRPAQICEWLDELGWTA